MSRIILLDSRTEVVTGGQMYNKDLVNTLSKLIGAEIVYSPPLKEKYSRFSIFFSPFLEIFELRKFKRGDFVFYKDTAFKKHILLLIFSRIFSKSKSILVVHHYQYLWRKGIIRRIIYFLELIYSNAVDYLVVPSPYTYDIARKMLPGKEIMCIPLPLNIQYSQSQNYIKGELLYVGTIEPRKGLIYLLKALTIVKSKGHYFHLNIVGKCVDDNYKKLLDNYIYENDIALNISFTGRVTDDKLEEYYNKSEIFVFPSLLEGYGIVLVEAMRHGLPIVAFNNSAIPYTVHDGENGYLARNFDYVDMADKINYILGNESMRHRMQENIKNIISTLKTKDDFIKSVELLCSKLKN